MITSSFLFARVNRILLYEKKGVTFMFNKIRYAYHMTACEKMIKKYKYDRFAYESDERFKRHKRKLNELMTRTNNKQK